MSSELMQRVSTVRDLLRASRDQIMMALPKHMDPDRLARIAMTTIQRTPKLLECDPKTLVGNIIQCAQLGLEPDGILGGAYLVPFNNPKLGKVDCQLIIGYKGLIDLARRSGQVSNIYARIVWDKESFTYAAGLKPVLEHTPLAPAQRGKEIVGCYAVAILKDGNCNFEFLYREEIDSIRAQSRAGSSGPWTTHYEEMAKKTAIRRLAKVLPLSPEFAKAAAVDELQEAGINTQEIFLEQIAAPPLATTVQPAEETPPPEPPPTPPKTEPAGPADQGRGVVGTFRRLLGEYCGGEERAMEKLCAELTDYNGRGLALKDLEGANPKRVSISLKKLKEMIEEDRAFRGE
jgi:recombination protein RecT